MKRTHVLLVACTAAAALLSLVLLLPLGRAGATDGAGVSTTIVSRGTTPENLRIRTKHATDFEAANERLQVDLEKLDGEYRAGLANCTTRTVVVSHDAFEYLGARYDLQMHPIAGLSPDAEPSARGLEKLVRVVRASGATVE